ncbi:MAG: hypothetical protein E5V75_34740, partial [Mesorhizobium sp.]
MTKASSCCSSRRRRRRRKAPAGRSRLGLCGEGVTPPRRNSGAPVGGVSRIPASYKGDYEKSFDGTGPFKLEKYTSKVGAPFVRNEDYWGDKVLPERIEFIFFSDDQSAILALLGGEVDVISLSAVAGVSLLNNPNVNIDSVKT